MTYKEIQYPVFLEAREYASGEFWTLFFEDMAYGNFPYGVYVKDKAILYCSIKNKEFSFQFYDKPAIDVYQSLYDIFFDKFRINNTFQHSIQQNSMKIHSISWKNIKKKMIKSVIIQEFVIRKRHEFDLSFNQIYKLLSNITLGLNFKLIDGSSHILYNDETCQIEEIKGVSFKQNQIFFRNVFNDIPDKVLAIENPIIPDLKDMWNKFLS